MMLFDRQVRRIVEQDANGDRRVYWTITIELTRGFALGAMWLPIRSRRAMAVDVGRWDDVHVFIGPIMLKVQRVADRK